MRFAATLLVTVMLAASDLLLAGESLDISALRALDQSYATEWIEADADGVMALFTEDATLVPHHGDDPIKAMRLFVTFGLIRIIRRRSFRTGQENLQSSLFPAM